MVQKSCQKKSFGMIFAPSEEKEQETETMSENT